MLSKFQAPIVTRSGAIAIEISSDFRRIIGDKQLGNKLELSAGLKR